MDRHHVVLNVSFPVRRVVTLAASNLEGEKKGFWGQTSFWWSLIVGNPPQALLTRNVFSPFFVSGTFDHFYIL